MNIGIVTSWFERGAAYVSKAYMDTLSKEHSVFIYARGGEHYAIGDPSWDLACVTWAPRYGGFKVPAQYMNLNHFENWIAGNRIDVVIFNEQVDICPVVAANRLGVTTGAYVDYYRKDTVEEFRTYDFLLCNTQRHYSVFRHHRNCLYLPWGTNVDLFKPTTNRSDFRGNITFFHSAGMGGIGHRKGTDLVVSAFRHVKGPAKLILHSQVPAEHWGSKFAERLRADTRIEFLCDTVTAPGRYYMGDVLVYPSRLEGIGLCMAEALACGLPIIVPNEEPMKDFVIDGKTGATVAVTGHRVRKDGYYWPMCEPDVYDLADKMQKYVDCPESVKEQKLLARKSAIENYNWAINSSILPAEITRICSELKKPRRPSHGIRRLGRAILGRLLKLNRGFTFIVSRLFGLNVNL